ncbi:NAD(P)-dependent dehydrogenase (short-subunit alcohol dehydrogenase family) [Parvibaculum indicum]|uniref:SDR family NAD(P)-dependent oxidoreductase n=1 Tax=Parvibaculum indicum TaxID=562969 RepID=UPI00141E2E89|nr:SDR family oxidoreductase [Parvibaculum indicum]NIJ40809.1 NAD(P)-dependent dehydrogenase (short-subunit alcohol dehydrogenase family) [Parvibaculum indicum]
MSLFDLTGKVAVVTGSTRGIGEAIVHRMAEQGAKVVVSSRKAEACEKVAADINAKHEGAAIAVPCNISEKADLQRLVDTANETFGKIDILVCNAAVNPYFGPSKDIPDEAFDKIMDVNVRSNHWLCHMVLPQMVERKDGAVIIVSSIGGLKGSPILGAYCLSKAADFQLARNLAVEFGEHNIRANCIAPGLIKTDFARALWEDPDILKRSTAGAPLKRIGLPDEIAGAAVFLASPAGAFMTGQSVVVDGGATIA